MFCVTFCHWLKYAEKLRFLRKINPTRATRKKSLDDLYNIIDFS